MEQQLAKTPDRQPFDQFMKAVEHEKWYRGLPREQQNAAREQLEILYGEPWFDQFQKNLSLSALPVLLQHESLKRGLLPRGRTGTEPSVPAPSPPNKFPQPQGVPKNRG
jgi:hypothetical protein